MTDRITRLAFVLELDSIPWSVDAVDEPAPDVVAVEPFTSSPLLSFNTAATDEAEVLDLADFVVEPEPAAAITESFARAVDLALFF